MVAQHLAALLQQKDEVIIPDLGTFSATYAHAEVHPVTHTFTPPNKVLQFNPALKISNGLFEKEISKRMSISRVEAEEEVKQFVSTLKINLGIYKKYVVDGVGDFQLLQEDQIEFKQNKEVPLLEESFGLPEIFAKPIERSKEELSTQQAAATKKVKKTKTEQKKPLPSAQPARKISLGSAIAIGSLALVATWVGLVLFVNDNLNPFKYFTSSSQVDIDAPPRFDKTDINVVDAEGDVNVEDEEEESPKNTENNTVEQSNTQEQSNTKEGNTGGIYGDKNTNKNENTTKQQQNTNNTTVADNSGTGLVNSRTNRYYIILGSFSTRQNASNFAQDLRNRGESSIKIIAPFNGQQRYRVAYDSYPTEAEAESKANSLRGKFGADIWVLNY